MKSKIRIKIMKHLAQYNEVIVFQGVPTIINKLIPVTSIGSIKLIQSNITKHYCRQLLNINSGLCVFWKYSTHNSGVQPLKEVSYPLPPPPSHLPPKHTHTSKNWIFQ